MRQPDNKAKPPGGPYPDLSEEEMPGGPAGVRLREFLQGRLPEEQPTEDPPKATPLQQDSDNPQHQKTGTRHRKPKTNRRKH